MEDCKANAPSYSKRKSFSLEASVGIMFILEAIVTCNALSSLIRLTSQK